MKNLILQVIFGVTSEQKNGANDRNRTDDLFITSELLYRLSYIGTLDMIIYFHFQFFATFFSKNIAQNFALVVYGQ